MDERETAQQHLDALAIIPQLYPNLKDMVEMYVGMGQVAIDKCRPEKPLDPYCTTLLRVATDLVHKAIMTEELSAVLGRAIGKMNADAAYGEEPTDDELAKADIPESLRGLFK